MVTNNTSVQSFIRQLTPIHFNEHIYTGFLMKIPYTHMPYN